MRNRCFCRPLLPLLAVLACGDPTAPHPGSLKVTASTSGVDFGSTMLHVDDQPARSLGHTAVINIPDLTVGSHTLQLTAVPANCTVIGENPRVVEVAPDAVTEVTFSIVCVSTSGVIMVTTTTTGIDAPGAYALTVDQQAARSMTASYAAVFVDVPGGSHTVVLSSVPSNCTAEGSLSRDASVTVGTTVRDTVRLFYVLTCGATAGVVRVSLAGTGVEFNDVFSVSLANTTKPITTSDAVDVLVPVGQYTVTLKAPTNCSISGSSALSATITASTTKRDTVARAFTVSCTATELIAFNRQDSIWVIQPDGSNPVALVRGYEASWAPDRKRMVVSRTYCDYYYYYTCYSMGLDLVDFTSGKKVVSTLTTKADLSPAWSPDGSLIAFIRDGILQIVKPNGTGLAAVRLDSGYVVTSTVAWSPDSKRLVFSCRLESDPFDDICVINTDRTAFARLTVDGRSNRYPAWSPDGTAIAFVRTDIETRVDPHPLPYLAVMKPDGTGVTKLASGVDPCWSSDSKVIVFTNTLQAGIASIKRDGTGLTRVTTNVNDFSPACRP